MSHSARVVPGGFLLLLALVFPTQASLGCRANPTTPSSALAGTWRGAITDAVAGVGTLELTMAQAGPGVSGTWSAAFANVADTRAGAMSGTSAGSVVSLFLTPAAPLVCAPAVTLTGTLAVSGMLSGSHLSGMYVVLACVGTTSGSIDVTRAP